MAGISASDCRALDAICMITARLPMAIALQLLRLACLTSKRNITSYCERYTAVNIRRNIAKELSQ